MKTPIMDKKNQGVIEIMFSGFLKHPLSCLYVAVKYVHYSFFVLLLQRIQLIVFETVFYYGEGGGLSC